MSCENLYFVRAPHTTLGHYSTGHDRPTGTPRHDATDDTLAAATSPTSTTLSTRYRSPVCVSPRQPRHARATQTHTESPEVHSRHTHARAHTRATPLMHTACCGIKHYCTACVSFPPHSPFIVVSCVLRASGGRVPVPQPPPPISRSARTGQRGSRGATSVPTPAEPRLSLGRA